MGSFFTSAERRFASLVSRLGLCNPFGPERIDIEREILGRDFRGIRLRPHLTLHEHLALDDDLLEIARRVERTADELRAQLVAGASAGTEELQLYEDLVLYHLYQPHRTEFDELITRGLEDESRPMPPALWEAFRREFARFLGPPVPALPSGYEAPHVFACFFQVRRAFYAIHRSLVGMSRPVQRLRAAIWESIFTYDIRRYSRTLHRHMADGSLLVTGPSGTGKELVARAVGLSGFIPFDAGRRAFAADFARTFLPVNLSALAPGLIESELFGHAKGAFTGALGERKGLLESCGRHGAVFLDEIGELDGAIQVKLLRVLQTREMQRVGDAKPRRFQGKVIAATNRDIATERRAGRFRDDLYYRLCSDRIVTPSLHEQLRDRPDDLSLLVRHVAERVAGDDAEALAADAQRYIEHNLPDHTWPGNVRELEQCVRSVMIRRSYEPDRPLESRQSEAERLAASIVDGDLTLHEMERAYATLVYEKAGGYREAGRRLGCDWRTLKTKVDAPLLARLRGGKAPGA